MEEAGVPKAPRLGHATSHQTRPNPVRDDSGADLFILHPDQLWGRLRASEQTSAATPIQLRHKFGAGYVVTPSSVV